MFDEGNNWHKIANVILSLRKTDWPTCSLLYRVCQPPQLFKKKWYRKGAHNYDLLLSISVTQEIFSYIMLYQP